MKYNYDNTKELKDEFIKIFDYFEKGKEKMNFVNQPQEKVEENMEIIK